MQFVTNHNCPRHYGSPTDALKLLLHMPIPRADHSLRPLQENQQKTSEDLQCQEDRVNHLNKVKAKLERSLDELEDSVEREKKLRADVEKNKRRVEGDLKLTQEAVADLERNKKELEQTIARKDKEIASLSGEPSDPFAMILFDPII